MKKSDLLKKENEIIKGIKIERNEIEELKSELEAYEKLIENIINYIESKKSEITENEKELLELKLYTYMKAAKAILDQLAKYQKEEVIEMHRDKIKKLERNSQVQKISNWKRSLKVDANPIVLNSTIKENKEIKPLTKYEE